MGRRTARRVQLVILWLSTGGMSRSRVNGDTVRGGVVKAAGITAVSSDVNLKETLILCTQLAVIFAMRAG